MSKALVIFSGGQDSTTCLFWARAHYDEVFTLTFDYHQRHRREIDSARQIAALVGVANEVLNMGPIFAGLSPLTNDQQTVARYQSPADLPGGLENTFVPGRNILFLSVAANRAYVLGCDQVIIGVSEEDFGGYPDCRLEFIHKMESALQSGLDRELKLVTPLIALSKGKTVELAMSMPGCMDALSLSTTCYNGTMPPCRSCHSCLLREKGFMEAGVDDPLLAKE